MLVKDNFSVPTEAYLAFATFIVQTYVKDTCKKIH